MTTNYGERPGIVERGAQGGPRTMSAATEARDRAAAQASERPLALLAVRAYAELDAERAAHARTLEALRRAVPWLGRLIVDGGHLHSVAPQDAVGALEQAESVLAQARGEARP